MRTLLGLGIAVVLLAWDIARNDGAWLGYAAAEISRAAFHLGF